jgi:hypothetical protein
MPRCSGYSNLSGLNLFPHAASIPHLISITPDRS